MTGKFRNLGLALIAVLALGTVGASAALATETPEFTAGKSTVASAQKLILQGSSTATQTQDMFGSSTSCTSSALTGTVSVPSSTVTLTPSYAGCTAFGTFPSTVITNGCDYLFHVEKTEEGVNAYLSSVDIVCPAGKAIEINIYLSGKDEGTPSCLLKMGSQSGLKSVTFKVDAGTPDDITLGGTIEKIAMTQTRNSFLCPAGTSTTEAKWTIPAPVTLQARTDNAANELIDVWID